MPLAVLLETIDVAALVIGHLDAKSVVALGRTSRDVRAAQRSAIHDSPQLLVSAASNACMLTKSQMMGWFALCGSEADELPRERYLRRAGGYYFLYGQSAFDQVLGTHLAGVAEWEARLAARGRPVRRRKRVHPGTCTRMPLVDYGLGGS